MEDAKEEIRARLPVEDVVGQYIELKRAGRNLKGRSPWGVDKTPSFMVSPEKGIWHDFSANKGGDIFTFVMEVEGISFREALEKLAAQAGVELTRYAGGDKEVAKKKQRALEALELACKYYQLCLTKNRAICEYVFYKRNMNRKTVGQFRIGYAPKQGRVLVDFLKKRGFTQQEIEAAGLLNRFGGDLFRERMMVPFIDTRGVIGFTARVVNQGEPKYLNTPDTILFNKSRFVFGLAQAKEAIRKSGFIVIVEGNMDVISSHQAGVAEAVATSGTAMTELHLKTLSRLTNDIRLAYDGDAAGVRATERAIMLAGGLGINLSVISDYHGAKDPDELIQKDPALWQAAVQKARPAVDYLLDKMEEDVDISSGPGKREYSDRAMKLLKYVTDAVERKHYEQLVARRLDCSVEDLQAKKLDDGTRKRYKKVAGGKTEGAAGGEGAESAEGAAGAASAGNVEMVQKNLQAILLCGGVEGITGVELPEGATEKAELELIFEARYQNWEKSLLEKEAWALLARYKDEQKRQEVARLTAQLESAGEDEAAEILKRIMALRGGGTTA